MTERTSLGPIINIQWIFQFIRFLFVGSLNTAIDFGILNLLIFLTGIATGVGFAFFKAAGFIVANLNSFFWNRYWVFKSGSGRSSGLTKEYAQFFVISVTAIVLNVGSASFVVNGIEAPFGIGPRLWANVGAVVGTIFGVIWNFIGYKLIVFKA